MRAQSVNAICMCLRKQKRQVSLLFPFGSTVNCPKSKETVFQLHTLPTSNFCGSYLSKLILRTRTLLVRVFYTFLIRRLPPPRPQSQQRKITLKSWSRPNGWVVEFAAYLVLTLPAPGHSWGTTSTLGMVSMDNPAPSTVCMYVCMWVCQYLSM